MDRRPPSRGTPRAKAGLLLKQCGNLLTIRLEQNLFLAVVECVPIMEFQLFDIRGSGILPMQLFRGQTERTRRQWILKSIISPPEHPTGNIPAGGFQVSGLKETIHIGPLPKQFLKNLPVIPPGRTGIHQKEPELTAVFPGERSSEAVCQMSGWKAPRSFLNSVGVFPRRWRNVLVR